MQRLGLVTRARWEALLRRYDWEEGRHGVDQTNLAAAAVFWAVQWFLDPRGPGHLSIFVL